MIRKSGNRFSEKIMLKQKARAGRRSNLTSSRSAATGRGRILRFLAMKEWPMRRVKDILSIALLTAGMVSPALADARRYIHLKIRSFFFASSWCPSICPSGSCARLFMTCWLLAAFLLPAAAADYDLQNVPVLRGSAQPPAPLYSVGPATFTRWSGFYVGGDVSFNNGTSNFSSATAPGIEFALQNTVVQQTFTPSQLSLLGNGAGSAFGGGAFLGYNTQWQALSRCPSGIVFTSKFRLDCRGRVRASCTRNPGQNV
jgi:hypothetical protein